MLVFGTLGIRLRCDVSGWLRSCGEGSLETTGDDESSELPDMISHTPGIQCFSLLTFAFLLFVRILSVSKTSSDTCAVLVLSGGGGGGVSELRSKRTFFLDNSTSESVPSSSPARPSLIVGSFVSIAAADSTITSVTKSDLQETAIAVNANTEFTQNDVIFHQIKVAVCVLVSRRTRRRYATTYNS